jgi:hypothetical protein
VARSRLTKPERARRYLQASMSAGATGLPAEQRRAYEEQLRGHERAYSGVRRHALAGSRRHFDRPLAAGEREHQRHLRERERLGEGDVLGIQRDLDAELGRTRSRSRRQTLAGPRAAKAAAGAAAGAVSDVTGGRNTVMYFIGVLLLLSLVYLLVTGKGPQYLAGITKAITGAVSVFVKPVDPVAALERSLGARPVAGSPQSSALSPPAPSSTSPVESAPRAAGPPTPTPAKAGALTWSSLNRAIRAHRLSPAQVKRDISILTGHG